MCWSLPSIVSTNSAFGRAAAYIFARSTGQENCDCCSLRRTFRHRQTANRSRLAGLQRHWWRDGWRRAPAAIPRGYSLTASRRAFAGVNDSVLEACDADGLLGPGIAAQAGWARSGREGLRQKPAIVRLSPLASASAMAENPARPATSASELDREVLAATWAVSSRVFTLVASRKSARLSVSRYGWSSDSASTKGP